MTTAEVETWGARCQAFVRERMAGDPAHDLAHVGRVVAWADATGSSRTGSWGVSLLPAA